MTDYFLKSHSVIQSFNGASDGYDEASVLARTIADKNIARLEWMTIDPKVIVDVGAGTGYAAKTLEKRYKKAKIFLVEPADKLLIKAKQTAPWFTRQRFIKAFAHELPFPSQSVDLLFTNMVLHWVTDMPAALKEWRRVLKPEGLLIFSTVGPDTLMELRQSFARVDDKVHVNRFMDMHDVGDALVQAKFADPVLDVEHYKLLYPDVLSLMRELKALGVQNRNDGRRKTLTGKQRMKSMMLAYDEFRNENNQYPASYEIVYGHAWGPSVHVDSTMDESGVVSIPISRIKK